VTKQAGPPENQVGKGFSLKQKFMREKNTAASEEMCVETTGGDGHREKKTTPEHKQKDQRRSSKFGGKKGGRSGKIRYVFCISSIAGSSRVRRI